MARERTRHVEEPRCPVEIGRHEVDGHTSLADATIALFDREPGRLDELLGKLLGWFPLIPCPTLEVVCIIELGGLERFFDAAGDLEVAGIEVVPDVPAAEKRAGTSADPLPTNGSRTRSFSNV